MSSVFCQDFVRVFSHTAHIYIANTSYRLLQYHNTGLLLYLFFYLATVLLDKRVYRMVGSNRLSAEMEAGTCRVK